jgi:hypothetical protein
MLFRFFAQDDAEAPCFVLDHGAHAVELEDDVRQRGQSEAGVLVMIDTRHDPLPTNCNGSVDRKKFTLKGEGATLPHLRCGHDVGERVDVASDDHAGCALHDDLCVRGDDRWHLLDHLDWCC